MTNGMQDDQFSADLDEQTKLAIKKSAFGGSSFVNYSRKRKKKNCAKQYLHKSPISVTASLRQVDIVPYRQIAVDPLLSTIQKLIHDPDLATKQQRKENQYVLKKYLGYLAATFPPEMLFPVDELEWMLHRIGEDEWGLL